MNRVTPTLLLAVCFLAALVCGCSMIGPLVGAALPYAGAKMMFSCIPEHTRVDTPSGPRAIEQFEAGDLVIGFGGKPVRILQKHSYLEDPKTLFLHVAFAGGVAVDLCGMHRIDGIRACRIQIGQTVAGRPVIGLTSHCGETHSFDLLTEDAGYQVQGVPVNSMIQEMAEAAATNLRSVRR